MLKHHYPFIVAFSLLFLCIPIASKAESVFVNLDQATINRGFTVESADKNVKIGILPGTVNQPIRVAIHDVTEFAQSAPGQTQATVYEYSIFPYDAVVKPIPIKVNGVNVQMRALNSNRWEPVSNTLLSKAIISASGTLQPAVLGASTTAGGGDEEENNSAELVFNNGESYIVIDAKNGSTLKEYNAQKQRPIASLTKLMTALIVVESEPNWDKEISYVQSDFVGGAMLWAKAGDVTTVKDLFYSTLVGSQNNSAHALARSTGLSTDEFVERMNLKARSLGLTHTHFVEPTGLNAGNISTASEYSKLARYALGKLEILQGTTTKHYTLKLKNRPVSFGIANTNRLLDTTPYYVTGSKTGWTYEAGRNLMMKARNNSGTEVITVVMGAQMSEQFEMTEQLLDEVLTPTN